MAKKLLAKDLEVEVKGKADEVKLAHKDAKAEEVKEKRKILRAVKHKETKTKVAEKKEKSVEKQAKGKGKATLEKEKGPVKRGKRGLSLEEKCDKLQKRLMKEQGFYTMKELEKIAMEEGINFKCVKEVVDYLLKEKRIRSEKSALDRSTEFVSNMSVVSVSPFGTSLCLIRNEGDARCRFWSFRSDIEKQQKLFRQSLSEEIERIEMILREKENREISANVATATFDVDGLTERERHDMLRRLQEEQRETQEVLSDLRQMRREAQRHTDLSTAALLADKNQLQLDIARMLDTLTARNPITEAKLTAGSH